jgi:integrase
VGKELIAHRRILIAEHEREPLPVHPRDVIPRWKMGYVPKDRHLTPHEFERVMVKAPKPRRLWLMVAVYTGGSLGELERLEWSHVDLRTGQIRLPGTKAKGRNRRVPIPAPLLPWLADAAKKRGRMFARWTNVRRDLAGYADAARVPKFTPNDLRRTYASWLVQAGVPHLTVSHLMGHSSTRMVEKVYGRLTPAIYTAAVANLPACDTGVPDTGTKAGLPGTIGNRATAQKGAKP